MSVSYHWTPDDFRRHGHAAVEWLARYLETIEEHPVQSPVAPGWVRDQLPASPPAAAEPFEDVERRAGFEARVLEFRDDQGRPRQIDRLGRNLGLELRNEKERRTHRAHCDASRSPALMATVMRFSRGGTGQTYDAS